MASGLARLTVDQTNSRFAHTGSTGAVPSVTVPGLTGQPSLRATVTTFGASATTVRVSVAAPTGADQMMVSDDPSFGGMAWQPISTTADLSVTATGYVEIFGRFRVAGASQFAPAITGIVIDPYSAIEASVPVGRRPVRSIGTVAANVVALTVDGGLFAMQGTKKVEVIKALDPAPFDVASSFVLTSTDDPMYAGAGQPGTASVRTTRPSDAIPSANDAPKLTEEHRLFVAFPTPLKEGARYALEHGLLTRTEFVYDTRTLRSPALQVNQLGHMPNDPAKVAFLSASLAGQQPMDYSAISTFDVIATATNKIVLSGTPVKRTVPNGGEYGRGDLTGAPVWELDYSSLTAPGTYRVCVPAVGCSAHVIISPNGTWLKAAATVARAAFYQRSGLALGSPYASFDRPRIEHPTDGRTVQASGLSLLQNGRGNDDTFDELAKQASSAQLAGAWGGHMDAGDWDRRIQHLWYLRAGLDLVDLYPDTFNNLILDIPESANNIPDVIDEGLWGLDFYLRMQTPDGGVRGGVEADAGPPEGGTSWSVKQKLFAYAPDAWSSYLFAGAAGEAAYGLRDLDPDRSRTYVVAAQKAAAWAATHPAPEQDRADVEAQRLVAAAALYRATGDASWQEQFLLRNPLVQGPVDQIECHVHGLCDAAWIYLRTPNRTRVDAVVANAKESFRRTADSVVAGATTSAYGFSLEDVRVPLVWGLGPAIPKTTVLLRAYALFADKRYWAQAARSTGFSLGANPLGTSFVTGLGRENPRHPLMIDQRNGGIPVWPGVPVFGTMKLTEGEEQDWFMKYFLKPAGVKPGVNETPALWSWYDIPVFAGHNEFTLYQSHAVSLFAYGALAALGGQNP